MLTRGLIWYKLGGICARITLGVSLRSRIFTISSASQFRQCSEVVRDFLNKTSFMLVSNTLRFCLFEFDNSTKREKRKFTFFSERGRITQLSIIGKAYYGEFDPGSG